MMFGNAAYGLPEDGARYFRFNYHYSQMSGGKVEVLVTLDAYRVLRETPKGVILDNWGEEKRVIHTWTKKFAYPTRAEAWESFRARLANRISYLERDLRIARLAFADKTMPEKDRQVSFITTNPFDI